MGPKIGTQKTNDPSVSPLFLTGYRGEQARSRFLNHFSSESLPHPDARAEWQRFAGASFPVGRQSGANAFQMVGGFWLLSFASCLRR
jgi:hypothetical protein